MYMLRVNIEYVMYRIKKPLLVLIDWIHDVTEREGNISTSPTTTVTEFKPFPNPVTVENFVEFVDEMNQHHAQLKTESTNYIMSMFPGVILATISFCKLRMVGSPDWHDLVIELDGAELRVYGKFPVFTHDLVFQVTLIDVALPVEMAIANNEGDILDYFVKTAAFNNLDVDGIDDPDGDYHYTTPHNPTRVH